MISLWNNLFSRPIFLIVHVHPPVKFLLHTVKEIGAACVLAQLHVGIYAVTVLRLHIEQGVEEGGKFTDGKLAVVDAAHLRHAVKDLNEVGGFACPAQDSGGLCHSMMIVRFGLRIQWWHLDAVCGKVLPHLADEGEGLTGIYAVAGLHILQGFVVLQLRFRIA